ncbi:hypothetical protein U1Q18_005607, partial [Sarracenia purpurea var. burkii]
MCRIVVLLFRWLPSGPVREVLLGLVLVLVLLGGCWCGPFAIKICPAGLVVFWFWFWSSSLLIFAQLGLVLVLVLLGGCSCGPFAIRICPAGFWVATGFCLLLLSWLATALIGGWV